MIKILSFLILINFYSCSVTPFKAEYDKQSRINKHLGQGNRYLEGPFSNKYENSGKIGVYIVSVGSAVYRIGINQKLIENAAIADAKFRLVESAPTEFKKEIIQSIGTEQSQEGQFFQEDIAITKVKNLTGIVVRYEDVECRTRIEPTVTGSYITKKECRAIGKVKKSELEKAYEYTISNQSKKISKN